MFFIEENTLDPFVFFFRFFLFYFLVDDGDDGGGRPSALSPASGLLLSLTLVLSLVLSPMRLFNTNTQ